MHGRSLTTWRDILSVQQGALTSLLYWETRQYKLCRETEVSHCFIIIAEITAFNWSKIVLWVCGISGRFRRFKISMETPFGNACALNQLIIVVWVAKSVQFVHIWAFLLIKLCTSVKMLWRHSKAVVTFFGLQLTTWKPPSKISRSAPGNTRYQLITTIYVSSYLNA